MTPQEIRFGINGLTALVVLSVAGALANLTWRLAGEPGGPSAVGAAMEAYVPPAPPPDISAMINLPPFGRVALAPEASVAGADLGLTLRGVLLANPATASTALIAAGDQSATAYAIGDPLPGGAILSGMGVDYVTLRSGEQTLTLYFPDDPRNGQAAGPPPAQMRDAQSAPASGDGINAMRALLPPSARGNAAPSPSPAQPVPVVQAPPSPPPQNSSGGNALIDSLGATVTPQGYRVGTNLSPQFRAAGLAPGDVVASVNGVSASTFAADPRRLTEMMASGEARVEVLRGGKRVTLVVPVR